MRFVCILLIAFSLLGIISCGGGGGSSVTPQQPPAIQVGVSPVSATLNVTMSQQFSAQVLNSGSNSVNWAVKETGGGSINAAGVYNAPATAGTYHVIATATADLAKSATATVTVQPPVAVTIAATSEINVGHAEQLSATVTNNPNTAVTWAVQEGAAGGSVTSAGLYSAPATSGTYHVFATSAADPTKSDTIAITVLPPVAVTIATPPNFNPGQSAQLTATVANTTNNSVTWTVQEGAAGGSISTDGLYTAPSAPGTYHVLATSVADTSASSTSTIGVFSVTVTPGTPIINPGQKIQLSASIANAADNNVTWSVREGASGGTINSDGIYVAPATAGTYHVVAATQFDTGISSEQAIVVTQPVQAQAFMNKAARNAGDLFLTFVSDSTCYSYGYLTYPRVTVTRWCLAFATDLAQQLPQYTVKYRQWNYGTGAGPAGMSFDGWATIQNGTGPNTLWISNTSFPGATSYDFLAGRFATAIADTTPDLVIVGMGHNYKADCPTCWPNLTLDLTESIAAAFPNAGLILVSPNPTMAPYMNVGTTPGKVDAIGNVSQWKGYGYINTYQAFLGSGYPLANLLLPDGVHPTDPGEQVGPENGTHLWATEVSKYFVSGGATVAQQPSSLASPATDIEVNGTFQNFVTGALNPPNWAGIGSAVVTKDLANHERANVYSVKVSSTGYSGYLQQTLPVSKVAGKCVTATTRVWVDAGQTITAGRIGLADSSGGGSTNTTSVNIVFGAWRWESVTRCFDLGITAAWVRLFGDTTTTNGAASFGEVSVTVGTMPHANPAF